MSTRALVLRLDDGRVLRGFACDAVLNALKEFLGSHVVLEGEVTFQPSGEALSIEVESVTLAAPGDEIWARLPNAEPASPRPRSLTSDGGLDSFFGKWPGDETDEQLAWALRSVS